MARLYQDGFEINSNTTNLNTWDVNAGASVGTTHARSGTYALNVSSLSSGAVKGNLKKWASATSNGPFYTRVYIYIVTLPSAENRIIALDSSSGTVGSGARAYITIDNTGVLRLYTASGPTQIGSASSALSTNTWYRVEMHFDNTGGAGADTLEAQLNGTSFASSTTTTMPGGIFGISVGMNLNSEAQTTGQIWFDDIAVNDSTGSFQNSWCGDGKILHLWPNAAGDSNGFLVQVGGTAGSTNNYTRVDENPSDDATSYNASAALNAQDLFNVTDSGIGSSDTVNVVMVGARFANITGADATAAIALQIEKTSGGTITSSSNIVPNSTSWNTNAGAIPRNYPLITYQDPDGSAWTQTTLDSMQIGYQEKVANIDAIGITNIWASVDYTPSGGTLHTQSVSGTFSTSGVLNKQYQNGGYQATYSASGTLTKAISRLFGSSYSGAGNLNRFVSKSPFTATFSDSGVLIKTPQKSLNATFSTSGSLVSRAVGRTLTATYSAAGTLTKFTKRLLSATFSDSGQLNRTVNKAPFTATFSGAGTLTELIGFSQLLTATYSTSGVLVNRSIARTLIATYSTSGTLTRAISRALTATFSASGVLSRLIGKTPFVAQMVSSGSLSRRPGKSLTATFSASGQLNKQPARTLTATFYTSGSLAKLLNRLFIATFSDSGVLTSIHTGAHLQTLTATFSTAGALVNRAIGRTNTATYQASGNLNKQTSRKLTASQVASGVLVGSRGLYMTLTATFYTSGNLMRTAGKRLVAQFQAIGVLVSSIKPGPIKPPTPWTNADIKNDSQWTHTHKPQTGWTNADIKNDTGWKQVG